MMLALITYSKGAPFYNALPTAASDGSSLVALTARYGNPLQSYSYQRETNSGGTNVKTLLDRPLAFFVLSLLILASCFSYAHSTGNETSHGRATSRSCLG